MWASWRQELPRGYFSVLLQDLALLRAPLLLLEISPPPNSSFSISLIPPGTGAWPPSLLYPHILLGALKPTHKVHLLLCLEAQMTKLRFSNLWQSTQTQYLKKSTSLCSFYTPTIIFFFHSKLPSPLVFPISLKCMTIHTPRLETGSHQLPVFPSSFY